MPLGVGHSRCAFGTPRQEVLALLGDIYLTLEGGPGVAREARIAHAHGALVPWKHLELFCLHRCVGEGHQTTNARVPFDPLATQDHGDNVL